MPYPLATDAEIAFFREHGWIVVRDALPAAELDMLEAFCDQLLEAKEELAKDWAWDAAESLDERSFRIVQSSPSFLWRDIREQPYRKWLAAFGSALLGRDEVFWYDQFIGKPPGKSVPTAWHQDEAYWGRKLDDKGVTCWIPLQAVDARNGCMHFIDRGHRLGVLPHHAVPGMQSDAITCDVDETDMVVCPIARGDVTFHHSKTPHMTTANLSDAWRKAVSNHMQAVGAGGEGDHYPWKLTEHQGLDNLRERLAARRAKAT